MSRKTRRAVLMLLTGLMLGFRLAYAQTATPTPTQACCQPASGNWASKSFSEPWGVAVDAKRNLVYVTDMNAGELRSYDTSGNFQQTLGTYPTAAGVYWTANDRLYVGQRAQGVITRLDPSGGYTVTGQWSMPEFAGLQDIYVDPEEHLYVTTDSALVWVFNLDPVPSSNTTLSSAATLLGVSHPVGIRSNATGLYVVDSPNQLVLRYVETPTPFGFGAPTTAVTGLTAGEPAGIAIDAMGNYYVNTGFYLTYFDSSWNPRGTCNVVGMNNNWGIAVDPAGFQYIAARNGPEVVKLDPCLMPYISPTPTPSLSLPGSNKTYIYPSPVRGSQGTVCYKMEGSGRATITVWNESAEKVLVVGDTKAAGVQTTALDLSRLPSGVYYYQVSVEYSTRGTTHTGLQKFLHIR